MATIDARLRTLEARPHAPASELTAAQREALTGEVRALLAQVPNEDDRAELLRCLEESRATDADRARLAGCSLDTLRIVVGLY